jgi:hypothetical protein
MYTGKNKKGTTDEMEQRKKLWTESCPTNQPLTNLIKIKPTLACGENVHSIANDAFPLMTNN